MMLLARPSYAMTVFCEYKCEGISFKVKNLILRIESNSNNVNILVNLLGH